MKGFIKALIGVVIVLVAIILIVGGALKLYFTQEKIIALVKPQIEKATNRKIEIKGAEFSLLKGFVLTGLAIKEADGKSDFASLKEFSISYELWPLLEKKLKVNSISLIDPKINIVRFKNGIFNYETLIPQGAPKVKKTSPEIAPEPGGSKAAIPIAITLNNVSITNAHIYFKDESGELPNAEATINLDTDLDISPNGAIKYEGEISIEAMSTLGDLPSKIKSHVVFNTSKISIKGDLWLDKWMVTLAGYVRDYTKVPKIGLDIASDKLDLDAIRLKIAPFLEASKDNTSKGTVSSASENTSAPPILLPPIVKNMEAKGKIEIGELICSNLPIKNVKVLYQLKDGNLEIKKEIGDLSGGQLISNIELQLVDEAIPFKGNIVLNKVGLGGLMQLVAPKLTGVIVGDLNTQLSFSGSALPQENLKNNLVLKGTYGLKDGKIMRNPITIAISRLLNMKELEEPSFKSVDGNIDLEKGWIIFKSIYSSNDLKAKVEKGKVSLDGALDVPLVLELSKELSQKLVAKQNALRVLLNDNGIAELPIAIKGTYSHPTPSLNMKKAKDQLIKGVIKGFFGN